MRKALLPILLLFTYGCTPASSPNIVNNDALPKVKEVVSDSGIKAWLVEDHSLPLLAVRVLFKEAGSSQDPYDKQGLNGLAVELLGEGAGKRNSLAFSTELENHAIRMNFSSDVDYMIADIETLSENREMALELLSDALVAPRFESADIERVRRNALIGLKMLEQSPGYKLGKAYRENLFGNHPYGKVSEGTVASIKALRKSDFETWRKRYLTRGNMQVSVVGDISEDELKTLLDKYLGRLPEHFDPEFDIPQFVFPENPAEVHVEMDIPQTVVLFVMPGLVRTHPDYFAAYTLNQLLGGGTLTSKLGKEIREERGLTYGIGTYMQPRLHFYSLKGNFSTRNDQAEEAIEVVKQVLEETKRGEFSEEEVEKAKSYLHGSFMLSLDTNDEVAALLSTLQLFDLGTDYIETRAGQILSLTKGDLQKMADTLIQPDRMMIVTVGKEEKDDSK